MKTIDQEITSQLIVKNSKFITYIFPLSSNDISSYLDRLKEEYPKATHYCYAYIFDDIYHYSDDGEPSNTAGLPLYNVLEKNNLNHVLVVVIRYFGGIKLGAGGLVRSYTKALSSTLLEANFITLEEGYLVKIKLSYQDSKNLDYLLRNYNIISKEFKDDIFYIVEIPKNDIDVIKNYSYEIIKDTLIKSSN